MKRNKFFIFLAFLILVGCSDSKRPATLVSKWDELNGPAENILERKLANTSFNQNQCLKDVFTVDTLKEEIKALERKYVNGKPVTGSWKHIDLSRLPIPQANFLKTFGNKLGDLSDPDSIDFRSCEDVPCIYNKIYGRDEHIAGYVHYLWYLKFNSMLSADNVIPYLTKDPPYQSGETRPGIYNQKLHSLDKYLYDDRELYGFWRLSNMLDGIYQDLPKLKEIQRLPRGESFEGLNPLVCGLAGSVGWITLNNGCLQLKSNNLDQGEMYASVVHEFSHHVDFELGSGTTLKYRSHRPDYAKFANLTEIEYTDESNRQIKKWTADSNTKYVTSYAKTNPQENFAESLAYFRVDGDMAKRELSDEHYQFIASKFFQNNQYDKVSLIKSLLKKYTADTNKAVFKIVLDCSDVSASSKSLYFKASDFSQPMMPAMLNCLGQNGSELANLLKAKIALREPEGCSSINEFPGKTQWDSLVKAHLIQSFNQYLGELSKDKEYIARIQTFYDKLTDKTIAQDAYVGCYGEADMESCYETELKKSSYENALSLRLPQDQTKEMADMYVSYHSFESIQNETKKSYQTMIASHLDEIRSEADILWKNCRDMKHNDEEIPSGRYFQVGDGYLVSSFYNCLNAQIPGDVKEIVHRLSIGGKSVEHPKEELILIDSVLPEFVGFLKESYKEEREKEYQAALDFMSDDQGSLRKQVLANFHWVKNIADGTQIMNECKVEAYKVMRFSPLYALKKDLFGNFLEDKVCNSITSTNEFNRWIDSSKDQLSNQFLSGLESKMQALGSTKAKACLGIYPIKTAMDKLKHKEEREACLINEWPKLEEELIKEAVQDPVALKFKIPPEVIKGKVEVSRRRIQIRVIKEYFK